MDSSTMSTPREHQHPQAVFAVTSPTLPDALEQLRQAQRDHSFWQNRLLKACAAGELTRADFQFVFSQYYLYSKNFTRYLAALMANSESDYHRARLAENLWEEGGMAAPEDRHAEIFRRFLRDGLGLDVEAIAYLDCTRYFANEYLDFCKRSDATAGAAFLSLGTEAIVSRLYTIMINGLRQAGMADADLRFFHIHVDCDDEHAATLEKMMLAHAAQPGWFDTCLRAMNHALGLRERFFERLYDELHMRRLAPVLSKIQDRRSLAPERPDMEAFRSRATGGSNISLYDNLNERLNINFAVERVPFPCDVLDLRILHIAPHRNNELHKHPHESVFFVMTGRGKLRVNDGFTEIQAGDVAFVPRWAMHQTTNLGDTELVILAVTDFGLTQRAFLGNHLKSTRMKGIQAALPAEICARDDAGSA